MHASSPDKSVLALAWMMFLVPALGVPSELVVQDTLKSAIVAFGVLGSAMVFFWQRRGQPVTIQWHGLLWLPIALMVFALGSMVWSHTYLAGVEAIRWFLLSLLLWLGLNTLNRDTVPTLVWGIHGGATAASVWVSLQFWGNLSWFPQGAFPASTFVNRNFFAEYAVCALPFSVWLLAQTRTPRWLGLLAVSLALNIVAVMMTGTRSALVALTLLIPVMAVVLVKFRLQWGFVHWSRNTKIMVAAVFLASTAILGSLPSDNPRVAQENVGVTAFERGFARTSSVAKPSEYTEGSFSVRSMMWMATARMMIANRWTGVGAGAWEVQIPLYQRADTVLETDYYAHNETLQLLSEYGVLVGGLVLAVLMAYLLHAAGTSWRLKDADLPEAPLRLVTLTSLLAFLLVSQAGFPLHLAGTGALFSLALAILAGSDVRLGLRGSLSSRTRTLPNAQGVAAVFFLCACTALATYITIQAVQAERKIVHALHLGAFLGQELPGKAQPEAVRKAEFLQNLREGIAINPHYRKFTAVAAEQLTGSRDFANAVWVQETVAASRPYVPAIWSGLALNYAQLGQHDKALVALGNLERLKPAALETLNVRVTLLTLAGQADEAVRLLTLSLDAGQYDYALLQTGYALGLRVHDQTLAVRSLQLFNARWPQHAADTYFGLGSLYVDPAVGDDTRALEAFRSGMAAVPMDQKDHYRGQVPIRYRSQM
jgi:O-antigen ligase